MHYDAVVRSGSASGTSRLAFLKSIEGFTGACNELSFVNPRERELKVPSAQQMAAQNLPQSETVLA
jgi:hypothetical protein